jgi:hypothetical protein
MFWKKRTKTRWALFFQKQENVKMRILKNSDEVDNVELNCNIWN